MAIYIKTNKGVESYVYKWITTISKELWTLAIKYFFTVFYRGGDYYFLGTGGFGVGGGDDGVSTLSLPGVLTCPDIQSPSFL